MVQNIEQNKKSTLMMKNVYFEHNMILERFLRQFRHDLNIKPKHFKEHSKYILLLKYPAQLVQYRGPFCL